MSKSKTILDHSKPLVSRKARWVGCRCSGRSLTTTRFGKNVEHFNECVPLFPLDLFFQSLNGDQNGSAAVFLNSWSENYTRSRTAAASRFKTNHDRMKLF